MAYNEYQKMHYTALSVSKKTDNKKPKQWGLYEDNHLILSHQPYPVLVAKKKELSANGIRFLKIKPV